MWCGEDSSGDAMHFLDVNSIERAMMMMMMMMKQKSSESAW
jgi:hypothetical protein